MAKKPKKFRNAEMGDFPAAVANVVEDWIDRGNENGFEMLSVMGPAGVGKTHLAWAMMDLFGPNVKRGRYSYPEFWKSTGLIMEMQAQVGEGSGCYRNMIENLCEHDNLIVIDDLGTEKMTDFAHTGIVHLISTREELMLPTMITSNLTIDEIAEHIDQRVASRLAGGVVIGMQGKDRRVKS